MKTLIFSLVVSAGILTSTFAQAANVIVPSFKSKINNYTSIPNDQLSVRVDINCSYTSGFVWPESKSCGSESHQLAVAADGTVVVPNLHWQKKSGINKYRMAFLVQSKNQADLSSVSAFLDGKEIKNAAATLKELSIYEMPALKINVVTPTGEDYASWRGFINHPSESVKDPCVQLIFRVNAIGAKSLNGLSEVLESENDKEVAGSFKTIYFASLGNPGKNVQVVGDLYYGSSKPSCEVNQHKMQFDKAVEFKGSLSEVHQYFNNSSYRVD